MALRALSGYLTPSNGYIGFPYYPLVRPKIHRIACDIGPKGEARTHRTALVLVLTLFKIYCIFGSVPGTGLRWYSRFFKSASLDSYDRLYMYFARWENCC